MKTINRILSFIITIILFLSSCCFLSGMAIERSTSSDVIKDAMHQTNAVDALADEIMNVVPGYIGESYTSALEKVIKSDPMTSFYSDYLEEAISAIIKEEPLPEVNEDALSSAFSSGFDEVEATGDLGLSDLEIYLFDLVKNQITSVAASKASEILSTVDENMMGEDLSKALNFAKILTDDTIRLGSLLLTALCMLALLIINFRRAGWLIWGGLNFILCGGLFLFISTRCSAMPTSGEVNELIDRVIMVMFSEGTGQIGFISMGAGFLMLLAGIVFKIVRIFVKK